MEEKIIKIVAARLRRFGAEPMNQDRLSTIREDVYKATRTNKFASFSNVKKWVKAARNYMKKSAKEAAPSNRALSFAKLSTISSIFFTILESKSFIMDLLRSL